MYSMTKHTVERLSPAYYKELFKCSYIYNERDWCWFSGAPADTMCKTAPFPLWQTRWKQKCCFGYNVEVFMQADHRVARILTFRFYICLFWMILFTIETEYNWSRFCSWIQHWQLGSAGIWTHNLLSSSPKPWPLSTHSCRKKSNSAPARSV